MGDIALTARTSRVYGLRREGTLFRAKQTSLLLCD